MEMSRMITLTVEGCELEMQVIFKFTPEELPRVHWDRDDDPGTPAAIDIIGIKYHQELHGQPVYVDMISLTEIVPVRLEIEDLVWQVLEDEK